MTNNEEKEIIRVCGENYSQNDIPAYIINRDKEKAERYMNEREDEEFKWGEIMTDMFGEGGAEEVRKYYEDKKFAREAECCKKNYENVPIKNKTLSQCCRAEMLRSIQCENCGSDGIIDWADAHGARKDENGEWQV